MAALTEVFHSFADFDGSIAEQLLHAGADPWAPTFTREAKRPAELADGGFDKTVSAYHMSEVPSPETIPPADLFSRQQDDIMEKSSGWKPSAAQSRPLKAAESSQESVKLKTDCLQTNNKQHLFLNAAVTPGTHVWGKAQKAEHERTGFNLMYSDTNATRQNTGVTKCDGTPRPIDDHWIPNPNPFKWSQQKCTTCGQTPFKGSQQRKTPTRLDGVQNTGEPSFIERVAVFARGHEADNNRLRLIVQKMEFQIWEQEKSLNEAETDLRGAIDEVDHLLRENAELRAENGELRGASAAGDDRGSESESNSSDGSEHAGGGGDQAASSNQAKAKSRKAEQARKARELVGSGAVLTRSQIEDLNKAELRAYLKMVPKAAVRGNVGELKDRLRLIFDANGIDTFKKGDDPLVVPSRSRVRFHVPTIPSVEDPGTLD